MTMYRRELVKRTLAPPRVRRVNDDELRRLWPSRLSDKEIAARLGHHRSVVRRRAARIGLRPRRLVWQEAG